jgi:hypothetical protein
LIQNWFFENHGHLARLGGGIGDGPKSTIRGIVDQRPRHGTIVAAPASRDRRPAGRTKVLPEFQ